MPIFGDDNFDCTIQASKPLKMMETNGPMVLNTLFGSAVDGGTGMKHDFVTFLVVMRCSERHGQIDGGDSVTPASPIIPLP